VKWYDKITSASVKENNTAGCLRADRWHAIFGHIYRIHRPLKHYTYQLKSLLRTGGVHWIVHGEHDSIATGRTKTLAYPLVLLNSQVWTASYGDRYDQA